MAKWFVADTHWGHNKIQQFCPNTRIQGTLEEHDQKLIDNWNSQVSAGDDAYLLGDVSFAGKERTIEILSQLKGNIHLIYGNHDRQLSGPDFKKFFRSRQDYKTIRVDGIKVVMFHYPIYEWEQMQYGAFHLFGHVHASYQFGRGRSMNVGIDARPDGDMMLWSWEEIKEILLQREIIKHH